MEIEKYIRELLYDYDCVIVPQLGGFVTNYRPASIGQESGIGNPPGKDILFNKNLTQSDGLLERAIATGSKISFEEAGATLKNLAEEYWSKLNGGEKVNFKKIGVLYIDGHKKLRFEPAAGQNYLKASFGFESFSLPPVVKNESKPIEIKAVDEAKVVEATFNENQPFKKSRSIYWVAAATLLPFVAMSIYMGLTTNFKSPAELTLAELVPFKTKSFEKPTYTERTTKDADMAIKDDKKEESFPENTAIFPFSFEKNEVDSNGIWVNLDKGNTPKEEVVANVAVSKKIIADKADAAVTNTKLYHIIAGCFGDEANANKYVTRLQSKGYPASILDFHKNLHRVELESFSDYSTALESLQAMRNDGTFPNAWLLKKPQS